MSQISKHINLTQDSVDWFYKTYGENASLSWLLDMLLAEYIRTSGEKTPEHYAKLAAENLKGELYDG